VSSAAFKLAACAVSITAPGAMPYIQMSRYWRRMPVGMLATMPGRPQKPEGRAQPASDPEPGPRAQCYWAHHDRACTRQAQRARCASHGRPDGAMICTDKLADGPFTGKLELATGKL
jgi:hypothetical protein